MKLQSALEYITVYGWAILIIAVILSAFLYLGVFNSSTFVNSQCITPADFSCLTALLSPNGKLLVNVQQNTPYTINVIAVGCNTKTVYSNMIVQSPAVTLNIGGNNTFTNIQCYDGTSVYNPGKAGSIFNGHLIINYTDIQTGFNKSVIGTLVQKVV